MHVPQLYTIANLLQEHVPSTPHNSTSALRPSPVPSRPSCPLPNPLCLCLVQSFQLSTSMRTSGSSLRSVGLAALLVLLSFSAPTSASLRRDLQQSQPPGQQQQQQAQMQPTARNATSNTTTTTTPPPAQTNTTQASNATQASNTTQSSDSFSSAMEALEVKLNNNNTWYVTHEST